MLTLTLVAINSVKSYALNFVADGTSSAYTFDVTLAPLELDFTGNIPIAVLTPGVTSVATGALNVTASILGTKVTLTFEAPPPPRLDDNSALIVYTASFLLQYPN